VLSFSAILLANYKYNYMHTLIPEVILMAKKPAKKEVKKAPAKKK
jgi:hypothetical protein